MGTGFHLSYIELSRDVVFQRCSSTFGSIHQLKPIRQCATVHLPELHGRSISGVCVQCGHQPLHCLVYQLIGADCPGEQLLLHLSKSITKRVHVEAVVLAGYYAEDKLQDLHVLFSSQRLAVTQADYWRKQIRTKFSQWCHHKRRAYDKRGQCLRRSSKQLAASCCCPCDALFCKITRGMNVLQRQPLPRFIALQHVCKRNSSLLYAALPSTLL
mmetsp:Transcript_2162/g.3570  ORF Transcript_2162/g.3570 Transcript_2162/m.3570 type:complete len:214 (+) Transcript_2162:1088-1729(+)